jgi:hypothetical protein
LAAVGFYTARIVNGVVVTIGGTKPPDVYTNNANYTGFGGNGSRTGTFGGTGANNPSPASSTPPIGPPAGGIKLSFTAIL